MAGSRLYKKETSFRTTFPKWSVKNYYPEGEVVWQNKIDSEYIDLYICMFDHYPNDSENNIYNPYSAGNPADSDSEGTKYILNEILWLHWATARVQDSEDYEYTILGGNERSIATINRNTRSIRNDTDSEFDPIDSEIGVLRTAIAGLPDSESVDSDLRKANVDLNILREENILKAILNPEDRQAIYWDSDAQKYSTREILRSLNSFTIDAVGNVNLSITKILSGTLAGRPDSDIAGTVYVVRGDSDSTLNGNSFIYHNNSWVVFVNPTRVKNDNLYLQVTGNNRMTGSLSLKSSTAPLAAVTKRYVDLFVKDSKQERFYYFDSEGAVIISATDSENFVVSREFPTLLFYDQINTKVIGDLTVSVYLKGFDSATSTDSDVINIKTSDWSTIIPVTLELYKNGVLESFFVDSDMNVQFDTNSGGRATGVRIVNAFNQNIEVRTVATFDNTAEYKLVCTTDESDQSILTKAANTSTWVRNNDSYDFGTY